MIIPEENKVFTVGEINGIIKEMLEGTFGEIKIKGEISNYKKAASGHSYFNLKDDSGIIAAVFFKFSAGSSPVPLKEGLLVTVSGKLSCYPKQGQYQIIVKSVSGDQTGDLYAQFEALKLKLIAEGLFEQTHKKPLPKYPKTIGVVTSPTGAVIRDIVSVISRRSVWPHIILAPSAVQGEKAAGELIKGIRNLHNLSPRPDVILLARGGGSIEDLWPFNDELLAREIYKSEIPIVSCVGHETDFTIADFVADLRAPTPSAGAELVSANKDDLKLRADELSYRLTQNLKFLCSQKERAFINLINSKALKRPETIWETRLMELDRLNEKLLLTPKHKINAQASRLALATQKLLPMPKRLTLNAESKLQLLKNSLKTKAQTFADIEESKLAALQTALLHNSSQLLAKKQNSLTLLGEKLNALNPSAVLSRGFAIVRGKNSKIIKSAAEVKDGSLVEITFEKDKTDAVITKGEYLFKL